MSTGRRMKKRKKKPTTNYFEVLEELGKKHGGNGKRTGFIFAGEGTTIAEIKK
jgi:hypothetical protein